MKLTITRSFIKTKQVASYEPINSHCSLQVELDAIEIDDQKIISLSQHLDILVRHEVERTIEEEMKKVEKIANNLNF